MKSSTLLTSRNHHSQLFHHVEPSKSIARIVIYNATYLEETYIHNLPLHFCRTLHIHSLPTDTTSITNLYTYYNLSYEGTEFKIILSTSNYMFYFLYLSRIQVKPQIFKVVENELSDERW